MLPLRKKENTAKVTLSGESDFTACIDITKKDSLWDGSIGPDYPAIPAAGTTVTYNLENYADQSGYGIIIQYNSEFVPEGGFRIHIDSIQLTPKKEIVPDVSIHLSGINTEFTSPGLIDFHEQLDDRFDLKYYDSMEVTYTYEATDTSDWTIGKIAVANTDKLNGYDNGLAYDYGLLPDNSKVTVNLSDVEGACAGINIQPMTSTYGWPAGLTKVTITGITFIAKEDASYETVLPGSELTSLKDAYEDIFDYMGTCINLHQLRDAKTLAYVKMHYSSVSLENEMKPDAILGTWNKNIISTATAKANTTNYVIPDSYKESNVPELHFDNVDATLKICKENGLKLRAHTLVWHSQTPEWFFKENYDNNGSYVSTTVMNARLEFYVRSVMNHVYSVDGGAYKDVVYT